MTAPRHNELAVLVLGINYAPEPIGIGPYTAALARHLAQRHCVSVVTTQPYYPRWRAVAVEGEDVADARIEIVRRRIFVPSNPNGPARLLHHLSFALAALGPMIWRARRRPNLVLTVAPSLMAAPVALLTARIAGARSWLHLQDFEVDAAVATGLVRSGGVVERLAARVERAILRRFDRVSTISPAMSTRLIAKGVAPDRVREVRNGTRLLEAQWPVESTFRALWTIVTPHVALYSGNIANKQGIEIVVEAARRMADRDDLTFIICGNGPNRARLEALAADLPNVVVRDLQPAQSLPDLLSLATVHLLPQLAGAADLVLPSKLTNMLASGRPVLATAAPGTGLADEVEGCGVCVPPGDATAFADALGDLLDDVARRKELGGNARARAAERWSEEAIQGRLEADIDALVGSAR